MLAAEPGALCSPLDSRSESYELEAVSLTVERAMPLPQLRSPNARARDVATPAEGVA